MRQWDAEHKTQRLWARDESLWTRSGESRFLGWLDVVPKGIKALAEIQEYAASVRHSGIRDVVVLGLGGSSLCARVFTKTFGALDGFPKLSVLDSTDPAQIAHHHTENTLFIVSSKSGTTLETRALYAYFKSMGARFIAITDPGTELALDENFERVFLGSPSIGGRFSALSVFGLLPASLMGIDITQILASANLMAHACGPSVAADNNPGVKLGYFIAENALAGRDKLTLLFSPEFSELGSWIEQLIAESLGKHGKGVIPIDKERITSPANYAHDRAFVYTRLPNDSGTMISDLQSAGHPVHVVDCNTLYDLGAQFFLWEFATAVAGSLLGINPFDQPDVEATKAATRRLVHAQADQADALKPLEFSELLSTIKPGDYFAICAFIEMNDAHEAALIELRDVIRSKTGVATTHGFGPCFLHSTGQLHKGGPNTGVFLQITCDDDADLSIPGSHMTFGFLKNAQARADLEVLLERGRRCARYHIKGNVLQGLRELAA